MPRILLQGRIPSDHQHIFKQYMEPHWTLLSWDPASDSSQSFAGLAEQADVIVGGNIPLEFWPATPNLKLFQIPWTGYNFTTPAQMPAGIPVANCFEHESSIAEYVMLGILEWQIGLRKMDERFRREGWGGHYPASGIFHNEVRGATLGIFGYGHIGEAVAKRAAAFDMEVIGIRRTKQARPELLSWLGTPEQLPELLRRSDFVLLACDLNDATRNLINKESIDLMQKHAVLINVSRGAVVDEQALFDALKSRSIGGAIIDVWYNYNSPDKDEVWPSNYPFQDLDNIILSAHECGWTESQLHRRWQFVAANVKRIEQGQEPENVVFIGEQPSA